MIENLVQELKRLRRGNANLDLSPEIMSIFFQSDATSDRDMNDRLRRYAHSVEETFRMKGSWNKDQQKLLSTFLDERYSIL